MPKYAGPDTVAMAIVATIGLLSFIGIAFLNIVMTRPGSPRLNQVVENYMARYPIIAAGLAGFVGAFAGHIFWATGPNPHKDFADLKLLPIALGVGIALGGFGAGALAVLGTLLKPLTCSNPSAILANPSRTLVVGEQRSLCVRAHCFWNDTELEVKQDEEYSVTASGEWWDWIFPSDAGGYQPPRWSVFQTLTARLRRLPKEKWFVLGAQLLPDDGHRYALGLNGGLKIRSNGRLILFANDARGFYWNNWGSITVAIRRLV
jgi:hypothetical protein